MDEATPRRCGVTDDIMALVFGAWNSPEPKLLMNIHTVSTPYRACYSKTDKEHRNLF
ncbi:MAG: hypothetical protein OIN86_09290 [Candidatus Methanoperedens sp.]|nr:hypothetical protein [Candidatus Methanoperedens sp.]